VRTGAVDAGKDGDEAPDLQSALVPRALNDEALKRKPKVLQIHARRAMIEALEKEKQEFLDKEDFLGAQRVKAQVKEQNEHLAALRRLEVPTPSRAVHGGKGSGSLNNEKGKDLSRIDSGSDVCDAAESSRPAETGDASPGPGAVAPSAPVAGDCANEDCEGAENVPDAESAAKPTAPHQADDVEKEADVADVQQDRISQLPRWRESSTPGLVELDFGEGEPPFAIPRDVYERLYDYQHEGVAWLVDVWRSRHGGVLADEMGLGKTVQLCAFLNGAKRSGATHALVVLPVSLLDQWAQEARAWCPDWPVYTYHGLPQQRERALRGMRAPQGGLLLTSYQTICNTDALYEVLVSESPKRPAATPSSGPSKRMRVKGSDKQGAKSVGEDDAGEGRELAEQPPGEAAKCGEARVWDVVICDEAHRMKNISSLCSRSLRRIRSRCRILLTGTPVQNALQDLWSLMDYAQPGLLGNHVTFVKQFSDPIDRGSVRGASLFAQALKVHLAKQLRSLVAPHLLRRTKASSGLLCDKPDDAGVEDDDFSHLQGTQWKTLPPKRETIIWLRPSDEQVAIYQKVLEKSEIIREAAAKAKLGIEVFQAIGLLKRLCNHPVLVLPMSEPGAWREVLSEATESLPKPESAEASGTALDVVEDQVVPTDAAPDALPEAAADGQDAAVAAQAADDARAGRAAEMLARRLPRNAESLLAQSAKLRCMALLLPALASRGHRTLVFSQSVRMLDLVQICVLKPHGLRCLRIDGQTDPRTRAQKVAKFHDQPDRFQCLLLSTSVGGVGLNLTGADRVVMVDPAWNPAADAQAVDRAYRIGQTKEVRVYRLITSGLIEDKMFRLQVFKMGLESTALEGDRQYQYFTSREIRALFEWTDPALGETRQLIRETHGGDADDGVQEAAADDGASASGWLGDWLTVGASDFGAVKQGFEAPKQKTESACVDVVAKQVAEEKVKLDAAEAESRSVVEVQQAVLDWCSGATQGVAEASAAIVAAATARHAADEKVRERRAALAQVRRAEAASQSQVARARRMWQMAQERCQRASQTLAEMNTQAHSVTKAAEEACAEARAAEEKLSSALAGAKGLVDGKSWDSEGKSIVKKGLFSAVDAPPDKLRKASSTLEKVRTAITAAAVWQAELEAREEELIGLSEDVDPRSDPTDRGARTGAREFERQRGKLEQAQDKAHQRSEAAREVATGAVASCVEAGAALAEAMKRTEQRPARAEEARAAQAHTRAAFRQLHSAWTASRRAKEALLKAISARSKAAHRVRDARAANEVAVAELAEADSVIAAAEGNDAAVVEERRAGEAELAQFEAARDEAEAKEARLKQHRDELREQKESAKGEIKQLRAAVKEAKAKRKAVACSFSKVERKAMRVEVAKTTALERLRSEEYDDKQVEQAYELKKKTTGASSSADEVAAAPSNLPVRLWIGCPTRRLRTKSGRLGPDQGTQVATMARIVVRRMRTKSRQNDGTAQAGPRDAGVTRAVMCRLRKKSHQSGARAGSQLGATRTATRRLRVKSSQRVAGVGPQAARASCMTWCRVRTKSRPNDRAVQAIVGD